MNITGVEQDNAGTYIIADTWAKCPSCGRQARKRDRWDFMGQGVLRRGGERKL